MPSIWCLISAEHYDFEGAVSPDSSGFSGCVSRALWGLGPVATKSNFKPRLLVRNWMEHYCKIPHLAVALQVRSGNQLSRAFCWPAFNRSPRDGQTQLPEGIQLIPTLVFVLFLWRWVGSRLDQRWTVTSRIPWIAIFVFMVVSFVGAFLPIGYTGFLPYAFAVWTIATIALSRNTNVCSGIPHDASNTTVHRN